MMMPRHGLAGAVIGNEFHLVSGMIQSAGAMTFFDPHLETHTAAHDVLDAGLLQAASSGKKAEPGRPPAWSDDVQQWGDTSAMDGRRPAMGHISINDEAHSAHEASDVR